MKNENASVRCPLCNSESRLFYYNNKKKYFKCMFCFSVFLLPEYFLSPEMEKKRYKEHNNDVNDPGYQKFVKPIIDEISVKFNQVHLGLDFGAGTGPVITKLLEEKGYKMKLYDPFFWNDPQILELKFDFIACCEVMEHFHNPAKEFKLLRSLLKAEGSIYCMTELILEEQDFSNWYYKNDPSHVFFYHNKALKWIQKNFNFSYLKIKGRLIELAV